MFLLSTFDPGNIIHLCSHRDKQWLVAKSMPYYLMLKLGKWEPHQSGI